MTPILEKILEKYDLSDKCRIRDPERVEDLLQKLVNEGPSKLQVITDFDHTLSRFHKDGKKCQTCHGIIDNSSLMPDSYRQKAKLSCEKYYPIEIDHNMSVEEKIPHMIRWYKESQDLLIDHHFSKSKIQEMVKSSWALLRDMAVSVLSKLNDNNVPVLIFSAGVGDVLEGVLHREKAFFSNVKVVSNYIVFDDKDECVAFKDPLIHMFNKNETAVLENAEYFQELNSRPNALVLGDSMGDLSMGSGIHNPGAILKIGFLNDKINERMDSFFNSFDVVLVDDQTFKFVDAILNLVLATPRSG